MHDLNFFEPYLTKGRQQQSASTFHSGRLIVVLLVVLAAWPLFNFGYGMWLKHEAVSLQAEVMNDENYPLLEEADAQKQYIAQLQNQLAALNATDKALKDGEWLNEPFLFSLLSTVPKDLKMEQVSVLPEKKIQVNGSAAGKPAIAELERNIRDADRFESVFVQSISNKDGTYSFNMEFELKGVGN